MIAKAKGLQLPPAQERDQRRDGGLPNDPRSRM